MSEAADSVSVAIAGERPRVFGHCIVCNQMVERCADGSCPAGHVPGAVAGDIPVAAGASLPRLPAFNWGAFLIPPVWGLVHGLWAGVFFVPLWVFVDNVLKGTAGRAAWMQALAWLTAVGTVAFQYEYARTANRLAWRRACERMTLETFVRRQRLWAAGGFITAVCLAVWIASYLSR